MPARQSPGPSVKNKKQYEELRKKGESKEKSARIANASAQRGTKAVGAKGGKAGSYEDWTLDELRKRASEIGISGRSSMSKGELVSALRNH